MIKFLSLIFIILFFNINCLFENVQNMEMSLDAIEIYNKIAKNKKVSLVLIYSDGCPHCRNFEPEYIKLAKDYYSVADFYLLPSKSNYKKKFKIRGVPTLFFFNGNKFIEHKGLNKYDIISYILENDYLKKCKEISYDSLFNKNNNNSLFYQNEKESNIIIGFFPNENDFYNEDENDNKKIKKFIRKKTFENFLNKTQKIISLIDNCYFIRDYDNSNSNNSDEIFLKEGTIISLSKSKGINIFKGYQDIFMDNEEQNEEYYDYRINYIGISYSKFINNKIKEDYIEITDSKMATKLKTFIKRNVIFFVYRNEQEKKNYINQISSLKAMTKNDNYPLFDYVLFKYGSDIVRLSYYFKSSGIYFSDKNLSKISKQIDLSIIIDMINTQNNYEYNEKNLEKIMNNNTNITNNNNSNNKYIIDINERKKERLYYEKIKERIIENQLQTYLDNIPEETMFSSKNIKSAIFFIICLIGYSLGFDYFYKKKHPGKSIFNIFNECIDCLNLIFCFDEDEEDLDIEQKKIQVKNKKRDDINEEKPKLVKVQYK